MATKARTGIFPSKINPSTGCFVSVTYRHDRIKEGESFCITSCDNFGSAGGGRTETNFIFSNISGKWVNFNFRLRSSGGVHAIFAEDVSITTPATTLNRINHYRNDSSSLGYIQVTQDPATTTGGTDIWESFLGDTTSDNINNDSVTLVESGEQMILKPNIRYRLKLTPMNTAIEKVTCCSYFTWYVEKDIE